MDAKFLCHDFTLHACRVRSLQKTEDVQSRWLEFNCSFMEFVNFHFSISENNVIFRPFSHWTFFKSETSQKLTIIFLFCPIFKGIWSQPVQRSIQNYITAEPQGRGGDKLQNFNTYINEALNNMEARLRDCRSYCRSY
jgi:hypothetical protein